VCRTPCSAPIRRSSNETITFSSPSSAYADQDVRLNGYFRTGAFIGGLIFGGGIGTIIDLSSGALWEYRPARVSATLSPTPEELNRRRIAQETERESRRIERERMVEQQRRREEELRLARERRERVEREERQRREEENRRQRESRILARVITIEASRAVLELVPGSTVVLNIAFLPTNATNRTIIWASSDTSVAKVDNNGLVTGISVGTATVTATTEVGGVSTRSSTITVFPISENRRGSWGIVTFDRRGHDVEISGHGITQIWSGAVTATACRKTTFNFVTATRRSDPNFFSPANFIDDDCRSNPNFPGDLFSWQAVVRYADIFCPYPWRIPTAQDFIDLDIALGGTGNLRTSTPRFITANYINRWGGAFGGYCNSSGALQYQHLMGAYWSQTACGISPRSLGFSLVFSGAGEIHPQFRDIGMAGKSIRCVR